MHLTVYDHNDPQFLRRKRNTNGAATYSEDIVRTQLGYWTEWFEKNYEGKKVVLSTCPLLTKTKGLPGQADLVVQYLHSFPTINPIGVRQGYLRRVAVKADRYIFITAYRKYAEMMKEAGMEAYYVPMAIDTGRLPEHKPIHEKRILWFGRIDARKRQCFAKVRARCQKKGWRFDFISRDKLNAKFPLTQETAWQKMAQYRYGIAVGRCALEMLHVGLKVFIAGRSVGGLIMNDEDRDAQHAINMNGRVVTFSDDIDACLANLEASQTNFSADIRQMNHVEMAGI